MVDKNNTENQQENKECKGVYGSTAGTTSTANIRSDDSGTDPSLANVSKYLKNLRKPDNVKSSKVAEMAEANTSGNGVMFGNKEPN